MSWRSLRVLVAIVAFSARLMAQKEPFLGRFQGHGKTMTITSPSGTAADGRVYGNDIRVYEKKEF